MNKWIRLLIPITFIITGITLLILSGGQAEAQSARIPPSIPLMVTGQSNGEVMVHTPTDHLWVKPNDNGVFIYLWTDGKAGDKIILANNGIHVAYAWQSPMIDPFLNVSFDLLKQSSCLSPIQRTIFALRMVARRLGFNTG